MNDPRNTPLPPNALTRQSRFKKPVIIQVAKLLVAVFLFYLLYRYGFFNFTALRAIAGNYSMLALAGLLIFITVPLGSLRWWLLLQTQGINISLTRAFNIFYLGFFANTVLLGAIGGDVVRGTYICKQVQGSRLPALTTILIDRIFGLYAILVVGALSGLLLPQAAFASAAVKFLYAVMVGLCVLATLVITISLIFSSNLEAHAARENWSNRNYALAKLSDLFVAMGLFRQAPTRLFLGLVFSMLIQFLTVASLFIICKAEGSFGLTLWECSFAASLALVASIIPITPGGLGVGEGSFAQVGALFLASNAAQGYVDPYLAFRLIGFLVALPGLSYYLLAGGKSDSTC